MDHFKKEECAYAVECYFRCGESVKSVQREFQKRFAIPPQGRIPQRATILNWVKNFRLTANANDRVKRVKKVRTPKKVERVRATSQTGPRRSIAKHSQALNIPRESISRNLRDDLQYHPCKIADDISDEHVNDNISTIKLEVNPESQDNTNSLNEACLTEPASAFIKIEPPDSPPSSQNINLASTSNSIYHSIKEETIIVDEDFERQSTSQLSCDITRSPESPNSNLNIKMEPPDSPSHEDSTVSSSNIKDELLFEVKSEPYVEQTLTKSEVISRMQAISDQLDTLSKKRQRQELKISSNEDPTRLQLLHNLLDNLVTEQTDKQLEYEDLTNVLRQYN